MGRSRASYLAPLLRSEAAARVLASVLLAPESLHIRAISDRTQLPYSVVQREIDRLEGARVVDSTRFGTSRVVHANENHPLYRELRALLLKAYGPREVLGEMLLDEPGVEEAYIHGSWAARYEGTWGEPPADVDVVIIGDLPTERREALEAEAEDLLGQPVQIEVVPRTEWEAESAPFVATVRSRPLVPVRVSERA